MDFRITNGASVTRIWTDDNTEFLAAFQYETDAISFAKARAAEDRGTQMKNWYIVSSHYSGAVTIVRPQPQTAAEAA